MTQLAWPILADVNPGDIVKLVFFLIVGVFWVISQLVGAKDKPAGPQRKVAPRPRPQQPAANADVTGEIEEFLKKATERREGQRPQEPVVSKPPRRQQQARANREQASGQKRPAVAASAPQRGDVAAQTQQHLDTRKFSDRASQLTSVDAGSSMAQHVTQTFDHQLGSLARQETPASAATERKPAAAAPFSWAAFLANPQSLREAVILNEIFQRPESRW